MTARPLNYIADVIQRDGRNWGANAYAMAPYVDSMRYVSAMTDRYMTDSATSIVAYFLSNASTWRGETARAIKTELKAMLKETYAQRNER